MPIECGPNNLELIKIILPSVMVVLGWVVVYRIQRSSAAKQDARKDLRTRLDKLDEDLKSLRDLCIDYYTDEKKGFELSTQIKFIFEDIRRQSYILSNNFLKKLERKKLNDILKNISKSATGGSFESKSRVALDSNDLQLNSLFNSSAQLITLFEDGFFHAYPPAV